MAFGKSLGVQGARRGKMGGYHQHILARWLRSARVIALSAYGKHPHSIIDIWSIRDGVGSTRAFFTIASKPSALGSSETNGPSPFILRAVITQRWLKVKSSQFRRCSLI
jgi:hypothetical protein